MHSVHSLLYTLITYDKIILQIKKIDLFLNKNVIIMFIESNRQKNELTINFALGIFVIQSFTQAPIV